MKNVIFLWIVDPFELDIVIGNNLSVRSTKTKPLEVSDTAKLIKKLKQDV